MDSDLFAKIEH